VRDSSARRTAPFLDVCHAILTLVDSGAVNVGPPPAAPANGPDERERLAQAGRGWRGRARGALRPRRRVAPTRPERERARRPEREIDPGEKGRYLRPSPASATPDPSSEKREPFLATVARETAPGAAFANCCEFSAGRCFPATVRGFGAALLPRFERRQASRRPEKARRLAALLGGVDLALGVVERVPFRAGWGDSTPGAVGRLGLDPAIHAPAREPVPVFVGAVRGARAGGGRR